MASDALVPDAVFQAWNELWVGACALHDRHLYLEGRRGPGDGIEWRVRRR